MKYRYYKKDNTIIAISTYAGKEVKGRAKCGPEDKYDEEYGKELAAARCNAKVADKRLKNATRKYYEAYEDLKQAMQHFSAMSRYLEDAAVALKNANLQVEELLSQH